LVTEFLKHFLGYFIPGLYVQTCTNKNFMHLFQPIVGDGAGRCWSEVNKMVTALN